MTFVTLDPATLRMHEDILVVFILVLIEGGEQSHRYHTMMSLAQALGRPLGDMVGGGGTSR